MELSKFERVAYDFDPSPLATVSRAAAFISLHSKDFRVSYGDSYHRVRVWKDVTPSGSDVYCAKLFGYKMRTGWSFSSENPSALLQDVYDYLQLYYGVYVQGDV